MERRKIAVGLSGGVDSAMAAFLLKREGHDLVGLTMKTWDGSLGPVSGGRSGCFGPEEAQDLQAAAEAARRLGIPHVVLDLAEEYRRCVLDYFRQEYLAGRTPNPCVRCNRSVKFGTLPEKARGQGLDFELFATGHYARVELSGDGRTLLKRGADRLKDQSYFLSGLTQEQLGRMALPLGGMTKAAVKSLARESGWGDFAEKRESQNFFEGTHYGALFGPQDAKPGPIQDLAGRVIGEHKGIMNYTIGQRKSVGLGGRGGPLYVVRLDARANTVTVGPKEALYSRRMRVRDVNWIALDRPGAAVRLTVQIRQQHKGAQASVSAAAGDETAVSIDFDEPQLSVTPGQTAAFYHEDAVAGAGTIESVEPA